MSPQRAILPITPEPGTTGFRSSSKTTVLPSTETVGPLFMAVSPLPMVAMPLLPDSEDPTASTITRFGKVLEELVLDRRREQRRRGGHRQQRGEVVGDAGVVEGLDQRLAHGVAGDHHRVGLLALHQAPHGVGIELGDQDGPVADEALAHHRPLGGAVHEGGDGQEGDLSVAAPSRPSPPGRWIRVLVGGRRRRPRA